MFRRGLRLGRLSKQSGAVGEDDDDHDHDDYHVHDDHNDDDHDDDNHNNWSR